MQTKKNPQVDLKNKRTLFFEIGMLLALTAVFAAFQYHTDERGMLVFGNELTAELPSEFMPITRREQPKPPEPPKPKIEKLIEIIPDDKMDDPVSGFNPEDDSKVGIVIIPIADEVPEPEPGPVYFAEVMPTFKGGMPGLIDYLKRNLNYPEGAKENNVQGKVFIEFVVDRNGAVKSARVAKGIDPLLDDEALRVVMDMPNWNPGMQNYKPISVCFTVPISFKLN